MKRLRGIPLFAILLVSLISADLYAECTTTVSATIVSQTWTKSNSPYCVDDDILVAGLTIEPGVRVEFLGDYVFEVAGVLTAIGTEAEPIIFTREQNNTVGWQGIFFNYSSPGSQLSYCTIDGSINSGIRIDNSEPTIGNCLITNNHKSGSANIYGGGIYSNHTLLLSNCHIVDNSVSATGGSSPDAKGGGIYVEGSLTMEGCTVENNSANASVYNSMASSFAFGGGVFVNGELSIGNSFLNGNSANGTGTGGGTGHGRGGGLYAAGQTTANNCILDGNSSIGTRWTLVEENSLGGGLYLESGTATLINCTVANNQHHGAYVADGELSAVNSIFWENTTSQVSGNATVTYSDVQNGYPGTGNIDVNPIFESELNLQIVLGSLCIDAGSPESQYNDSCFPPSLGEVRNDMGAHGGPSACGWSGASPCVDGDGDGYGNPAHAECTHPELDCNNSNPNIYPTNANPYCDCVDPHPQGVAEVCDDGADNDCDTMIDAADPDCDPGSCAGSAAASTVEVNPEYRVSDWSESLVFIMLPLGAIVALCLRRRKK
jgi:hypothetical protein